jgi:CRISPR-associated endonuclease/helicase Cas3
MTSPFVRFFRKATGGSNPYPYQERFATADEWPPLLRAPTGAGKTATAVLGWLFRWTERVPQTPRRLVYCLPMRVLVEQSFGEALRWLLRLGLLDAHDVFDPDNPDQVRSYRPRLDDSTSGRIAVHRLMGGIETEEWYLHPERAAILIGTQDMLLSRALNRGYAESRFHWPIDFGLLNNDCLWVFDEPQLMGSGVSTSAQLAGFRHSAGLGTFGPCPSVWMSATLEPGWLDTVDFRGKFTGPPVELGKDHYGDDYDQEKPLHKRMTAAKTLALLGVRVAREADEKEGAAVARKVLEQHREGTQTLVVLNTVKRAKLVYRAIEKLGHPQEKRLLVHSRFRPYEREGPPDRPGLNARLKQTGEATRNRIIVATQVVEAGVDISARTLVTELAPWASIVQRIGRCNRTGDDGSRDDPARVFWIDVDDKQALPYSAADLAFAREHLAALEEQSVSPKALDDYKLRKEQEAPGEPFLKFTHTHVLRRRDLLGLFDTSPDLSGNDIDIKHYIRGDDPDLDVKVFWRKGPPDPDGQWGTAEHRQQAARREELCNVPIGSFKDYLKAEKAAYRWDFLDKKWRAVNKRDADAIIPGQVFWVRADQGGYDLQLGWEPSAKAPVPQVPRPDPVLVPRNDTAFDTDDWSRFSWRSIAGHTRDVMAELIRTFTATTPLPLSPAEQDLLRIVVRWHDWGKAHEVFQSAVKDAAIPDGAATPIPRPTRWAGNRFIAKAPDEFWGKCHRLVCGERRRVTRFRHELASALGVLELLRTGSVPDGWQQLTDADRDLAVYLLATHHGKVRLSVRAMPKERPIPPNPAATRYAAGVWDRDQLPETDLGGGTTAPKVTLNLAPILLGGDSWLARALRVRDRLGPFRLAYLEAMVRAVDCAASARAGVSEEDRDV